MTVDTARTQRMVAAQLVLEARLHDFQAAALMLDPGSMDRMRDAVHAAVDALLDARAAAMRELIEEQGRGE